MTQDTLNRGDIVHSLDGTRSDPLYRGLWMLQLFAALNVLIFAASIGLGFTRIAFDGWFSLSIQMLSLLSWILFAWGLRLCLRRCPMRPKHPAVVIAWITTIIFIAGALAFACDGIISIIAKPIFDFEPLLNRIISFFFLVLRLFLGLSCAHMAYLLAQRFQYRLIGRVHLVALIAFGVLLWSCSLSIRVFSLLVISSGPTYGMTRWSEGFMTTRFLQGFAILIPVFYCAIWHALGRARKRIPVGLCMACGYNLTGNLSGSCPECGTETRKANPA